MLKYSGWVGIVIAMVFVQVVCAEQTPSEHPNNPYGVQLGMGGNDGSDFASLHFGWARDMVGEWGHVRIWFGLDPVDVNETLRALVIARAKQLIPIFTVYYVPEEYRIPGGLDAAPYVRDDGYPLATKRYKEWAAGMAALGTTPPFVQICNEINGKWDPEAYGKYLIAVNQAIKSELPDTQIVSAGLAGYGGDFLQDMIRAVPEVVDYIDFYGLQPYGANHPPSYEKDNYCLRGHEFTAVDLAEVGVMNPRFIMTESGYEIGNRKDTRYPRITDELRAEYLVEAYRDYWAADPRVKTLTLFMLQSARWPGWDGWVMINQDSTFTETYKALAAVPKPQGSDWMPTGPGQIQGRIQDSVSGQGVERVFLYTIPGTYAAETDRNGYYEIKDLPLGEYEIRLFRDGFLPPRPASVVVTDAQPSQYDAQVERVGFFAPHSLDGQGAIANRLQWERPEMQAQCQVDQQVKRSGTASQRITAQPNTPVRMWTCTGHGTAIPNGVYAAEVWVKGEGVVNGHGKGVGMTFAVTDSDAHSLSPATMILPKEGDFDWTPVTATVASVPLGRRLLVQLFVDAESGTLWFDDLYIHYADYPVSSRTLIPAEGNNSITGEVMGGELRLAGAVVALWPGNIWTQARSDGVYHLTEIPDGTYDLLAYHPNWTDGKLHDIQLQAGAALVQDITMAQVPKPDFIRNGDFEHPWLNPDDLPGWTAWGDFNGVHRNGWHKDTHIPEHSDGLLAYKGEGFAGTVSGSNVSNGGIHQVIAVEPGATYEAGVWMYTYQTDDGIMGDAVNRLGLDPTGGTDPDGPYVIWTPFRPSHKQWSHVTLDATAIANRMTVFLEVRQVLGNMFSVNLFDEVTFTQIAD